MVIESRHRVIYVSGALRSNQWQVIRTTAAQVYDHYRTDVLIDLSGVRWVTAAGESTFVSALNDIEAGDLPFVLVNFSPLVEPLVSQSLSQRLAQRTEIWWNRFCGVY